MIFNIYGNSSNFNRIINTLRFLPTFGKHPGLHHDSLKLKIFIFVFNIFYLCISL